MVIQGSKLLQLLAISVAMVVAMCVCAAGAPRRTAVEELDLSLATTGWKEVRKDRSVDNHPLSIGGRKFEHGIGTHAPSVMLMDLHGGSTRFTAEVGADDEIGRGHGSVEFIVSVDGKPAWRSGVVHAGDPVKPVSVDLKGARQLELRVTDGGDGSFEDHADWANPQLLVTGDSPNAVNVRREIRIQTANSSLVYLVDEDRHLRQLYYGAAGGKYDNSGNRAPDALPAAGNGWLGEPALEVTHANGDTSADLRFTGSDSKTLNPDTTETRIELRDPVYPLDATLVFRTYRAEDVIEQWVEVRHREKGPVTLQRFASSAPAFGTGDYWLTQFHGDWAHEMNMAEEKLGMGVKMLDSKLGVRAHQYRNPSFLLSAGGPAKEEEGEVFGGALAYSGSYQLEFEVGSDHRLRALCGMNPFDSEYHLKPGELFKTPSMLWGWSGSGKGDLSRKFHRWARRYGVRDGDRPRAVLLNNWEATYFDFDEAKLVSLFDGARALGMELFLLDDGWFGNRFPRNNDRAGLGDWEPNRRKLPHGIGYLADEAKKRGIRFGIWAEPEMVNPQSELYQKHPDWVIRQPSRELNLQRNQLILDLTRPAVREFVFKTMDDLLTQNPGVSYVKWDCNRYVTQPGSFYLGPGRQSHLWIDYVRALYDVMDRVAKRHPKVDIMICSGGGARADYGALRFGHEFWASDNTDPASRVFIQWGYSQLYPSIAVGAHVTTMGNRPLKFAFDVAFAGCLGMDMDLAKLSEEDRRFAAAAVADYKRVRDIVQLGDLYRLQSPYEGDRAALLYASPDRRRALLLAYQMKEGSSGVVPIRGLDPQRRYRVHELNRRGTTLEQEGQTLTGAELLRDGFRVPLRKQYGSLAIELTEAP